MYRLKDSTKEEKEAVSAEFEKYGGKFGTYNTMPEPWKEIPESQFWHHVSSYTPMNIEHRQAYITIDGKKHMIPLTIYWYGAQGYAFSVDRWSCKHDGEYPLTYYMKFYLFGCEHKWREMGVKECAEKNITHFGMCWHVYECEKCGMRETTDSSD